MPYVETTAIESQERVERKAYVATPPDVDQVIEQVIGSTGSDGSVTVRAVSPARTAASFEYDIDSAASWANTTGIFTGLSAASHDFQARDAGTPANTSIVLAIVVPSI